MSVYTILNKLTINNDTYYEVKMNNLPSTEIKRVDQLPPSAAPLVQKFEEFLQLKKLEDFYKNSKQAHANPPNLEDNNNSKSSSDSSCKIINTFKPNAKASTKKKSMLPNRKLGNETNFGETLKQELKKENESIDYFMKLEEKINQNNNEQSPNLNTNSQVEKTSFLIAKPNDNRRIEEEKTHIEEKQKSENESVNKNKLLQKTKGILKRRMKKYVHKKLRESIKFKELIVKGKTVLVCRSWNKRGSRTEDRYDELKESMKEAPEQFAKFLVRLFKNEIKENKF